MKLRILSAERVLFEGETQSVKVPGSKGAFEILEGHAPIISTLQAGKLSYVGETEEELDIAGGFIDVHENEVEVGVELAIKK